MASDGLVTRRRLLDRLSAPAPVQVVAAPSGFGKTTLVRSWVDSVAADRRPLVWVALAGEVTSRQDFWQLVVAGAARSGHLDDGAYRSLSRTIELVDDPVLTLAEVIDGHGSGLLVLDAYEHLRDLTRQVDDDLLRLANLVPDLGIVVTTRAATQLCDDTWALRGLVQVTHDSELRFTAHEVEQLLRIHAPHAVDAVEHVVRDTQGYPLAVRAVAHALATRERVPSFDSAAWRRLVSEDLKSQIADPVLAEFVLDTSVPPYFDHALARDLSGVDDVDRCLAELAWNGFGRWVPYLSGDPTFQYVESVRDVFFAQLRAEHPDRHERNAGLAASWLHRHHDHDQALTLAIDAGRYELASSICRSMVISNPDIYLTDLFERHLRRVPKKVLPRYPTLAFILGMIYAAKPSTQASAAEYFRIAAAHALDGIDELSPREAYYQYIGLEVCLRYLGRGQEAGAVASTCLAAFDSMSVEVREELGDFVPMSLSLVAYSLFQSGETDRAGVVVDRAVTSANAPWWRNYALGFAGAIHGLHGDRWRAEDAAASLADQLPLPDQLRRAPHVLGHVGRAAVRLDDFDLVGALDALDAAGAQVEAAESWPFITWVTLNARLGLGDAGIEARRVEEALARSRIGVGSNLATSALLNALAICWLADDRAEKGWPLLRSEVACPGQMGPAKLLYELVSGDPSIAVRSVADLLGVAGHTARSTSAVETLGAAAALRAGNDKVALALVERAASRHRSLGVAAHLMYVPADDLVALRQLAETAPGSGCEEYLGHGVVSPLRDVRSAPALLTPRELEVLRVWATHRTRAEVAATLMVSANTVKSQIRSAYRKLGVSTKDAAIQRALELGLLHDLPGSTEASS